MPSNDFMKKFRAGFKGTKAEDEESEMGKEFQDDLNEETKDEKKKVSQSMFQKIKSRFASK